MTDELYHVGTPHEGNIPHSGRYPYGSGENSYQHAKDFMGNYKRLKSQGYTEKEICDIYNMSSTELRARVTNFGEIAKSEDIKRAKEMKEKGYSLQYIANELDVTEGTIRYWFKQDAKKKVKLSTADTIIFLKDQVDSKGMIDVGAGVELEIGEYGISDTQLKAAIQALKDDGYNLYEVRVRQMTNVGKYTDVKVLAKSDITEEYANTHKGEIHSVADYDGGITITENHPGFNRTKYGLYSPQSIDSSRVMIRYAEDGGTAKDGVIELRRGVPDLSLGKSSYAQVRIAVDGTHYLKGMAIYSTGKDMPDGVDIIFNTKKTSDVPKLEVLKELKSDPDNPFGATIKPLEKGGQAFYKDADGNEHLSAINIVNEEGTWGTWNKTLSSQFLSKQSLSLIKRQLNLSYANKLDEYNDICLLTNPTIKQKLLEDFADDCDSAAVHLKAAAIPRQSQRVILPVPEIADDEVYAPGYNDGEMVCLVRYPHEGTFEIPKLKVNNKNAAAIEIFGDITDAIGISPKAASQLSGADFDGDSVTVLPTSNGASGINIISRKPFPGLVDFDTSEYEIKDKNDPLYKVDQAHGFSRGTEMGKISNLITDMTILGASEDELERATKHSMVVIDAEKHHLDWRKSYRDNNIAQLKIKYQGGENRGASTLISRASAQDTEPETKTKWSGENIKNGINVLTGEKVETPTGSYYYKQKPVYEKSSNGRYVRDDDGNKIQVFDTVLNDKGEEVKIPKMVRDDKKTYRTQNTTKMAKALKNEPEGAMTLVSEAHSAQEIEYATYANKLRDLAREARLTLVNTEQIPYSASAAYTYSDQVSSLNQKLTQSLRNAPRERMAQTSANAIYKLKIQDNPDMTKEEQKKVRSQTLAEQRVRYSAHRYSIEIDDKEWEAIQAGAISPTKLKSIIDAANPDRLRELAMPKNDNSISDAKMNRIMLLYQNGETIEAIAKACGISASTVSKIITKNR